MILEVIAFTIDSCKLIEKAGGGRIELCANPLEGGTTVSYGMMKAARESVSIPVFPIIRPRGGNFLYNGEEYAIMKEDIRVCRDLGMDGVVIGLLDKSGRIDRDRTSRLVELAYPMEVTFHRAFDHVREPLTAMEDIISAGCTRILTSGGADTAVKGMGNLQEWVKAADDRIIILPGSGIRSGNIRQLAEATGLTEFHSSARTALQSCMEWTNEQLSEKMDTYTVDPEEVKACISELKRMG